MEEEVTTTRQTVTTGQPVVAPVVPVETVTQTTTAQPAPVVPAQTISRTTTVQPAPVAETVNINAPAVPEPQVNINEG